MKHLPAVLGVLAAASLLAGCGPSVPPSAVDQQKKLVRDAQLGRCGEASATAKLEARQGTFVGPEGFDSRGCGYTTP